VPMVFCSISSAIANMKSMKRAGKVMGVTLLANTAAGVLPQPLSGAEVNEAAEAAAPVFSEFLLSCLESL